jgi:membrane fusion protein, multidrug efflux system
MFKAQIAAAALIAATVMGCHDAAPPTPEARSVRTVTVHEGADSEIASLTGQVRAKEQVGLAFRLDGRVIERPVHVGDLITAGQVVARIDPSTQRNALQAAEASLAAAEAQLAEARLTFQRQQELLKDGWTPRAKFDEVQQKFLTAQAQVESAEARSRIARDEFDYATLVADAPGVVTSVGAEPGEVVRPGQMVVQVARQGGRDAVFDVPEELFQTTPRDPVVEVVLTDDPKVKAVGRVRQVSPQADQATRTFEVKVGLIDPPEALRLGSTVTGRIHLAPPPGVQVPASALTEANGRPAVWVVNRQSLSVSLRNVEVGRYDPGAVLISRGLETGELVVTAGVQMLRPGQKVRLLGAAS